jgi:hypothetical protein
MLGVRGASFVASFMQELKNLTNLELNLER